MRITNDFHSWLRHSWKLLANRLTRDPKIVIHGNSCIILYVFYTYLPHKQKKTPLYIFSGKIREKIEMKLSLACFQSEASTEQSELILGLRPANKRRRYKVTPSIIGCAQT